VWTKHGLRQNGQEIKGREDADIRDTVSKFKEVKLEAIMAAKTGDTVKVHYTGILRDGTTFDSSREGEPLEFKLGERMVIPGFEDGILGMNAGDSKRISIPVNEAYGEHNNDLVTVVPRSQVPSNIDLTVGMFLAVRSPEGDIARALVLDITDTEVTLDLNHPLAGEDLIFDIELIEIS
jgi:peptidylprolyl isomerase